MPKRSSGSREQGNEFRLLAFGMAGLLLMALPLSAKVPAPAKAKPKVAPLETAVIENTGSTNTQGFRIMVRSDKSAEVSIPTDNQRIPQGHLTRVVMTYAPGRFPHTGKLFQDLEAAMPLASLPVRHGMRSASFGTQTFVTYKGQKSPDVTFAADPRTSALKVDVEAITRWLGIGNLPRHPFMPMPQSETH